MLFQLIISCSQPSKVTPSKIIPVEIETTADSSVSNKNPLKYPKIETGDPKIDSIINNDFKNRLTNNEYVNLSIADSFKQWTDSGIVSMDYEITLNNENIISFNTTNEFLGSYITRWKTYFNYSTSTGEYLDLENVIDLSGDFKQKILDDKKQIYSDAKKELETPSDRNTEIDEQTKDWALKNYEACEENLNFKNFSLHKNHLTIYEECQMPNAIKTLSILEKTDYPYSEIKTYLKIEL